MVAIRQGSICKNLNPLSTIVIFLIHGRSEVVHWHDLPCGLQRYQCPLAQARGNPSARSAELRARIEATRELPFKKTKLVVKLPAPRELGMISWLAYDSRHKVLWLLQRGDMADPIIEVDTQGHVLHSFGKGLFRTSHSIRFCPDGNLWAVDAGTSRIIEFSLEGKELLQFDLTKSDQTSDERFLRSNGHRFCARWTYPDRRRILQCLRS